MLDLSFFRGARPKVQPHLLEQGEAQKAVNCRLQTGALEPFRGSVVETALAGGSAATIHKFGDTAFWFEFADDVDIVEGPVESDTEITTYYTGDGAPAMTYASIATAGAAPYPTNKYTLGIPRPDSSPSVAVTGAADPDDEIADSRAYIVTYVSERGEEGPPSLPTAIVDVLDGQTVNLTNIPLVPTGNYNITAKRIYRTSSASGDTSYLLVAEIPAANDTYSDTLSAEQLGEVLPSTDWYAPPADMIGLVSLPNGVLAGFSGKDLYLSEPYLPHAWPYSITVDSPIVGLCGVRGGLVVATEGRPVIVGFTHPSSASQIEIESPRACVSKRSMVDMGEFAIYASADGLVAVDGSGASPFITAGVIDKYDWQNLNPETIHAYRKESWYIGFYQGTEGNRGFAITATGDQFLELDFYATGGWTDPKTGELYLVVGTDIVKWDQDDVNLMTYEWHSSEVLLPKPQNMACARVDAESYPVTFNLYSEGSLLYSRDVSDKEPFWLPANYLVRRYSISLVGTATVRRAIVADSMEALT